MVLYLFGSSLGYFATVIEDRDFLRDFHHELGLSVINPFRLPVRLDATYRLDDGRVFFTFGLGRF